MVARRTVVEVRPEVRGLLAGHYRDVIESYRGQPDVVRAWQGVLERVEAGEMVFLKGWEARGAGPRAAR